VTVEVRDVTDVILADLDAGQGGRERYQVIEDREKALIADCEKGEGYRCRVASYHGGLQYELIRQLEIRDVRLVYAPPESVGKYGGDIDNWMWPRHTGDFAFYRAYVGPDGKPADPDAENVPFLPAHHLEIAADGVDEGDFVMVVGYPGRTNRYRTAAEVESLFSWSYPTRKRLFEEWIGVVEEATSTRPDAALKYAPTLAGLNNASKNYGGMLEGFSRSDAVPRKQSLEAELQAWIEADPEREARYGAAFSHLAKLVDERQGLRERDLYYLYLARRSSLLSSARTLYRLSREREKPDAEREPGYQDRDLTRIRERLIRVDRSFDADVDRFVWRHLIGRYAAIPTEMHVGAFDEWFGIDGNSVDATYLDLKLGEMYAETGLDEQETRLAWMDATRVELEKSDDPFLRLA
ncbi:MAG: S46 family peptidase, partial [Xanthomonadales bacterium]|nr:S46 family peptidase [Xanthomonadales bacterium]NIX11703.1 S46 family peptidase [Xanthomonadales bacterium]